METSTNLYTWDSKPIEEAMISMEPFFGYSDNLHSIWDDYIIYDRMDKSFGKSQAKYTDFLVAQVKGPWASMAASWRKCNKEAWPCPDEWANESAGLACTKAYTDSTGQHIKNGFVLGEPYYDFTYGTVDQQLAKGGVRLAHGLQQECNKILIFHFHCLKTRFCSFGA